MDYNEGWEDTPYHKSSKRKTPKKKKGCPGNDGGAHVYVWVTYDSRWFPDYEKKVCCGCNKTAPSGIKPRWRRRFRGMKSKNFRHK